MKPPPPFVPFSALPRLLLVLELELPVLVLVATVGIRRIDQIDMRSLSSSLQVHCSCPGWDSHALVAEEYLQDPIPKSYADRQV